MNAPHQYTSVEPLWRGDRVVLYRAIRNEDHRPVVLKVLDRRRSRPRDLEQLKQEYELGKELDTSAAVKSLALETYDGMPWGLALRYPPRGRCSAA
jgi:hypothetical protein